MLFIRSINPSYRAPIPLPPTPHAGAQPLAGLMTWRAQKKKKKKRKSAYRRVYGGGALRTFLHPASLLILNFYPRTRQETCGGLVYAGRKRTRSLSTSLFCPPNGLAFSQPIYLPTLPTYSLSRSLSLYRAMQPTLFRTDHRPALAGPRPVKHTASGTRPNANATCRPDPS